MTLCVASSWWNLQRFRRLYSNCIKDEINELRFHSEMKRPAICFILAAPWECHIFICCIETNLNYRCSFSVVHYFLGQILKRIMIKPTRDNFQIGVSKRSHKVILFQLNNDNFLHKYRSFSSFESHHICFWIWFGSSILHSFWEK